MAVILLRDGTDYLVEDSRGEMVKLSLKNPNGMLDVYGDGRTLISKSTIAQVMTDEQFQLREHQRRGDWKCDHGHWHERGDKCGHGLAPHQVADEHRSLMERAESGQDEGQGWEQLRESVSEYRKTGVWPLKHVPVEGRKRIKAMRERNAKRVKAFREKHGR